MKKFNISIFILTSLVFFIVVSSQNGFTQESNFKGSFRERLKERLRKRLQERPPPETNAASDTKLTQPGDYIEAITHNGLQRMFHIHVPSKYNSAIPSPLLFSLHGGGGSMTIQAKDEYYKQISKSDKEGFIVVFPNGYSKFKSGIFATWNAGKCCGDARDQNIDDVGFIREVLNVVTKQWNIDRGKIFSTGMSNGGLMSYRLACELSDVFKAIASVAGTDNTASCVPSKPISILHIHAKDDDHVLFGGGAGKTFRDESKVTEFTSVPATISKWVKLNGCNGTPKRVLEKSGVYCDLYSKCKNKTEVQLCVTETGGHSWPGGKKPRGNGTPSTAISANDVMWEFFMRNSVH